jgi:hypothetical protein
MKGGKGKKGKKGAEEEETDRNGKPIRRKKDFGGAKTSNLEGMSQKSRTVAAKFGTTKRFFTMDHSAKELPGPGEYSHDEGGYNNFGSSTVKLSKSVPVFKMTGRPNHEVSVQNQTAGLIIHRTTARRPTTAPEQANVSGKGKTGEGKGGEQPPTPKKKAKVKVGAAMHDDRGGVLDTNIDTFKKTHNKAPVAAFGKSKRFVEERSGVISPGIPMGPAYTRDSVKKGSPAADTYAPMLNTMGNKNVRNKAPSSSFGNTLTRAKANYVVSVGTPMNQVQSRDVLDGTRPGPASYNLPSPNKTKPGTARENYSRGQHGSSVMGRSTRLQGQGLVQPGMPSVVSKGVGETPGPNHYGDAGDKAVDNGITARQTQLSTKKRAPTSGFGGSMGKMTRDHAQRMVQPGLPQRHVSQTPGPGAYDHKESNSALMGENSMGAGRKKRGKAGAAAGAEKGKKGEPTKGKGVPVNSKARGMEASSTFNRSATATMGKFNYRGDAGFAIISPGLPVKQTKAMADNPGPGEIYPLDHTCFVAKRTHAFLCRTSPCRRVRGAFFCFQTADQYEQKRPPFPIRQSDPEAKSGERDGKERRLQQGEGEHG